MSDSRIVLEIKSESEYKQIKNYTPTYHQDPSASWNNFLTQILGDPDKLIPYLNLVTPSRPLSDVISSFQFSKFKDQPEEAAKFNESLVRAFLYCQFVPGYQAEHLATLAPALSIKNYYVRDRDNLSVHPLLHYAVRHAESKKAFVDDCLNAVKNCLKAKDIASVINMTDDKGQTVFDLAVQYENIRILKLLLNSCNELDIFPKVSNINAFLEFVSNKKILSTSLGLTTDELKSPETVDTASTLADILLPNQREFFLADLELKEPTYNRIQSLHIALKLGMVHIVDNCLLSKNIVEHLNDKNEGGLTATDLAAQMKRYDILCDLYNKGADLSRTLAIMGSSGIKELLTTAYSSSSTAKDDISFVRFLKEEADSLLESGFSEFVLDILNNTIKAETLTSLIRRYPDLKDRLVDYFTKIIDNVTDEGIKIYFARQLLVEGGSIYPALAEPRGKQTNLTKTIRILTTRYKDLLISSKIGSEKITSIPIISAKVTKKQSSPTIEKKLDLPSTPQTKVADLSDIEIESKCNLDSLNTVYKKEVGRSWGYAFVFAGPKKINNLLKQARGHGKYSALSMLLATELTKDKDAKNLSELISDIRQNKLHQTVLSKMAIEQKDFSQRILNHLDTLPLEDAYDILDKSFDKHNPFHAIWFPSSPYVSVSSPFSKLFWEKYTTIKEKFLKKARELSISHLDDSDVSMIKILSQLREQKISVQDFKKLEQQDVVVVRKSLDRPTTSDSEGAIEISMSMGKDKKLTPKETYQQRLNQYIIKYTEELSTYSGEASEYKRLIDKINICRDCLTAIQENKSIFEVRKKWNTPDKAPTLFKQRVLSFMSNNLAKLMEEIIQNEREWLGQSNQHIVFTPTTPSAPPEGQNDVGARKQQQQVKL